MAQWLVLHSCVLFLARRRASFGLLRLILASLMSKQRLKIARQSCSTALNMVSMGKTRMASQIERTIVKRFLELILSTMLIIKRIHLKLKWMRMSRGQFSIGHNKYHLAWLRKVETGYLQEIRIFGLILFRLYFLVKIFHVQTAFGDILM